jgi:hypothetical protein
VKNHCQENEKTIFEKTYLINDYYPKNIQRALKTQQEINPIKNEPKTLTDLTPKKMLHTVSPDRGKLE